MGLFNKRCPVRGGAGRGDGGRISSCRKKEVAAMKCHRCGGVMVFEKFYGATDQFSGWRCIFCGEIIDPVIFENRLSQKR
jgi:hypothetical protein